MEHHALEFLAARLSWPVPVVRWRAARALRDLLNSRETKFEATKLLLQTLAAARCEAESCSVLTVFLMARSDARPEIHSVCTSLRHPSILSSLLLQHMYGDNGPAWEHAHSGMAPRFFEPEPYFEKHITAHVPPILSTHLRKLEQQTNLPFMRQWAFEWQKLQDATGTARTEYPYYFSNNSGVHRGMIGQYIQGQGNLFRSAYLRTLACAVNIWNMPVEFAKFYTMDVVPATPGIFEIDPARRPGWLADFPERCATSPDSLGCLVNELLSSVQDLRLRPVFIRAPISYEIAEYGELHISAYLATQEFENDYVPECKTELADFEAGLKTEVDRPTTPLDNFSDSRLGTLAPVCTSMLPRPHGYWQGHYFSTGMPVAASYVLPSDTRMLCTRGGVELQKGDSLVGTTAFWHDHWSPEYPRDGATRCGVWASLMSSLLDHALVRLERKLVWKASIHLWKRTHEFGEYKPFEKTVLR